MTTFSALTHPDLLTEPVDSSLSSSAILPGLVIRALQAKDLAELAELLVDSFHNANSLMRFLRPVLVVGTEDELKRRFYSSLSQRPICLVALINAKVGGHDRNFGKSPAGNTPYLVGTIEIASQSTALWPPIKPRSLYLSSLAIRQGYRRQGIAQRLMQCCEQIALARGFQDLYLHVMEHNHAATKLYLKMGYGLNQADPEWFSWIPGYSRRLFLHKCLSPITPIKA